MQKLEKTATHEMEGVDLILTELKSINKKLEVIASNFELKDTVGVFERLPDGKLKRTIRKKDLNYLG